MPGPFPYLAGFGSTQAPACRLIIRWDGRCEEIDALIDSGASKTGIPESIVQLLNLRKISESSVGGAVTKERYIRSIYVAELDFLGINIPHLPIYGLPHEYALIGRDILNRYITTLYGPQLQFSLD